MKYSYEKIADDMEYQIAKGQLKKGDKLPSERFLAHQFSVSRNVVREAIKTLREKGLITVYPGSGSFVSEWKNEIMTDVLKRTFLDDDATICDILDIREFLEVTIIRKAVQYKSEVDIQHLKEIAAVMEANLHDVNHFLKKDKAFHFTLAKMAQSHVFQSLFYSFYELHEHEMFTIIKLNPDTLETAQKQHKTIVNALEKGDEYLAVSTIKAHIDSIRADVEMLREMEV